MADDTRVIFRRIRGRLVAIKKKITGHPDSPVRAYKATTEDKITGAVATGTFFGSAYTAGRYAPPGGYAKAFKRVKKWPSVKVGRLAGLAHLGVAGVVGTALPKALGIEFKDGYDEGAGAAFAIGLTASAKRLARFGQERRTAMRLARALPKSGKWGILRQLVSRL